MNRSKKPKQCHKLYFWNENFLALPMPMLLPPVATVSPQRCIFYHCATCMVDLFVLQSVILYLNYSSRVYSCSRLNSSQGWFLSRWRFRKLSSGQSVMWTLNCLNVAFREVLHTLIMKNMWMPRHAAMCVRWLWSHLASLKFVRFQFYFCQRWCIALFKMYFQ